MPLAHLHLHLTSTSTSTCISCDLAPEEFRLRLTARAPRLLPQLGGRVVTTEAAGALGNTIFSTACSGGARAAAAADARRGSSTSAAASCASGKDPQGAWTRSVVDMYLGGLASGFINVLFSSCA